MKAKCIKCNKVVEGYDEIKLQFGFLRKRTSEKKIYMPQSICKACKKKKYKLGKILLVKEKLSQI
jgi:polyferredoxin